MHSWKDDPYVIEWLSKVGERTKQNYTYRADTKEIQRSPEQ
jgi:hypothetical protein